MEPLRLRPFVVTLFLAALAAPVLLAQEAAPEEAQDSFFFDTVDVNVVNVEVFVTDRKGVPVEGLTAADFELLEDGKKVEVTNFLAIADRTPGGANGAGAANGVSAAEGAPAPPRESLPRDQRLHVILFVDNLNTTPENRNQVIDHLRRFLRQGLDNQDRVMMMSFDGRLHLLQEFTSLPEVLLPLLDQQEAEAGRASEVEQARRQILHDISNTTITPDAIGGNSGREEAAQILSAIRIFAQQTQDRTRLTLSSLKSLVDSLAGLPGRKALVYVSDGLPLRPGDALFQAWSDKYSEFITQGGLGSAPTSESLSYDTTEDYRRLIAHANGNRVMFYTIDAARNRSFGAVSADTGGFDLGALDTASGGRAWTSDLDSRLTANYRESLRMMAEETGGQAFINTKGLGNTLESLASDFSTYYSLGYTPKHQGDGKYHRLEVRLKDRGKLKVRHRAGYQDKSVAERMGDRTLSALLLNLAENPLEIVVEHAPAEPREDGTFDVPLLIKVPLGKIALLPDRDVHQGRVTLFIAAGDEDNRTSPVRTVQLPIKIPNDKVNVALEQFAGYTIKLQMRGGFQKVAVGVRDDVATTASTVRVNFLVGAADQGAGG